MSSDDVQIHDPASRAKEKQPYGERDLEKIMQMRQWRNWDELINFVRKQGDSVPGVKPGEAKQMVEDFGRLKQQGAQVSANPHEIYQQAQQAR